MRFEDLDRRMRAFETTHDLHALPGVHLVARLDGRSFKHLTRETHSFEAPYDEQFRDHMIATARHVMTCGVNAIYGYTQSDEISILLAVDETAFGRRIVKLCSILAAEASAKFSLEVGTLASLDCRLSQLPREQDVVDYFRWRSEDAARNALNAHCYWLLRRQGKTESEATSQLLGRSTAERHDLLFGNGINFNDLPTWQKRGTGLYWEGFEKHGIDPRTANESVGLRRRLVHDFDLPARSQYADFVLALLKEDGLRPSPS